MSTLSGDDSGRPVVVQTPSPFSRLGRSAFVCGRKSGAGAARRRRHAPGYRFGPFLRHFDDLPGRRQRLRLLGREHDVGGALERVGVATEQRELGAVDAVLHAQVPALDPRRRFGANDAAAELSTLVGVAVLEHVANAKHRHNQDDGGDEVRLASRSLSLAARTCRLGGRSSRWCGG